MTRTAAEVIADVGSMDSGQAAAVLAALASEGFAWYRTQDAHAIELVSCCTYHDGRVMTSPSGAVVGGNGECAEFLLPSGTYHLVPVVPEVRCPRCDSPSPDFHPAMQSEGEVQPCPDPWHGDDPG